MKTHYRRDIPTYTVWDLNTFGNDRIPNVVHYVVKQDGPGYLADQLIVYDYGVASRAEQDTASATCKAIANVMNQESFMTNIAGRRFMRYETNSYIAIDQAEADRLMAIDHTNPANVRVTNDLEILRVANGKVLWSDGRITKNPYLPPGGTISVAAMRLIGFGGKPWRDGAWRNLLAIESYTTERITEFTDRYAGFGFSGSDKYTLERLTADDGQILYLVSQVGGCLGEDGDSWEYYSLYDTEHHARAAYRAEIITVLIELIHTSARYLENGNDKSIYTAWPSLSEYVQKNFSIKLPLQEQFANAIVQWQQYESQFAGLSFWDALTTDVAMPRPDLPVDRWTGYLHGFADALNEVNP